MMPNGFDGMAYLGMLVGMLFSAFCGSTEIDPPAGRLATGGAVSNIVTLPGRTGLAALLVRHAAGMPFDAEDSLQLVDVSRRDAPRRLSSLPLRAPVQLLVARGGMTAYVLVGRSEGDSGWRLVILDLRSAEQPKILATLDGLFTSLALTDDGRTLAAYDRASGIAVFDVTDPANAVRIASKYVPASTPLRELAFTGDGLHLIASQPASNSAATYDFHDPANPEELPSPRGLSLSGQLRAGPANHVYVVGLDGLCVCEWRDQLGCDTRLPLMEMGASSIWVSDDETSILLATYGDIVVHLDVSDPAAPREATQYRVPGHAYAAAMLESPPAAQGAGAGSVMLLVGTEDGLLIVDGHAAEPNADAVRSAHRRALAAFGAHGTKDNSDFQGAAEAIRILETNGIQAALSKRPKGMSQSEYAHILNDYAYFYLQQRPERRDLYVPLLRRVVTLDPKRAVAWLNLGDALRTEHTSASVAEIKSSYENYKRLTGHSTPGIDDYFALNPTNADADLCAYVAGIYNRHRMGEILVETNHADLNGDGQDEEIRISSQGSAHVVQIEIYGDDAAERIDVQKADDHDDVRWANTANLVRNGDKYYLLYQNYGFAGDVPAALTEIDGSNVEHVRCSFAMHFEESVSAASEDLGFCAALLHGEHPEWVEFDGNHALPDECIAASCAGPDTLTIARERSVALLDVENDGHPVPVAKAEYSSGAGPGCGYTTYELLNADRSALASGAARERLKKLLHVANTQSCFDTENGWFRRDGRMYFEEKSMRQGAHVVSYLKGGAVHEACVFDVKATLQPVQ